MANRSEARRVELHNECGNLLLDNHFNVGAGGHLNISGGNANNGVDNDSDTIGSLPYVTGAEYSTSILTDSTLGLMVLCHEGTRVALLDHIMAWSAADDARHVFWLSGLAGTGKSTIARTVARRCAGEQRLGASYFFVRGGGDLASADKFVTTVAVQLARELPELKRHICRAARALRNVGAMALQEQWARLVLQPLAKVRGGGGRWQLRRPKPIIIVVDALDECDSERDVGALLGLLALSATAQESRWLRVLLTSRPETRIRYGIQTIPQASLDRLVLHDVDPPVIDRDISIYLGDNLRCVGVEFLRDSDWPGVKALDGLVARAGGLFIWAATAYRFIARGGAFANDRLQDLLLGVSDASAPEQALDSIYMTVLGKVVDDSYREQEKTELCAALYAVLKTVIVLAAPVDRLSLSHLAEIGVGSVNKALHGLHSIIAIPDDDVRPIRLHHASFRDFIMDPRRCSDMRFSVDGQWQHKILAQRCLRLLSGHLRKDICDLRAPGVQMSEVDRRLVDRRLPPALQYACCYWAYHACQADQLIDDFSGISDFLHKHLLHWLEALCLLKKLPEAVHMLRDVELLSDGESGASLKAFVYDARRFLLSYVSVIAERPLQIYCSALLFAPSRSLVRQTYLNEIPPWICHVFPGRDDWSDKEVTIDFVSEFVTDLAFSPDGQTLASCSASGVSLWDPTTGSLLGAITDSRAGFNSMAYSPDGRYLAYTVTVGKAPTTVSLWDVQLQAVRAVYQDSDPPAPYGNSLVAFSPNGELTAAATRKVQVFSTMTLAVLRSMDFPDSDEVASLAFSPTQKYLAVVSRSIHIYGIFDGEHITLESGQLGMCTGLFSPTDELFAFGTVGCAVRFWQEGSGTRRALVGHSDGICDMVLTPDGQLLASSSRRECIVWELSSGARLYSIARVNGPTMAPTFSPSGRLLAWPTADTTVGFLHAESGVELGALNTSSSYSHMAFSPDGRRFTYLTRRQFGASIPYNRDVVFGIPVSWSVGSRGTSLIDIWDIDKLLVHLNSKKSPVVVCYTTTSSAGDLIALSLSDGSIQVWANSNGAFCPTMLTTSEPPRRLAFSPNGGLLSMRSRHTVKVLTIPQGDCAYTLLDEVSDLAFSPDSQSLALAKTGRSIAVYDFGTESLVDVPGDSAWRALAFSPDGNLLAGASRKHVYIYRRGSWEVLQKIRFARADALAISPDSRLLAAGKGGKIRLLDLLQGRAPAPFARVTGDRRFGRIGFSRDERRLITEHGVLAVPKKGRALPTSIESTLVHFHVCRDWINYKSRDILWLPPECRDPSRYSMHSNVFAWVDENGNMPHIKFDESLMSEADRWPSAKTSLYQWKRQKALHGALLWAVDPPE